MVFIVFVIGFTEFVENILQLQNLPKILKLSLVPRVPLDHGFCDPAGHLIYHVYWQILAAKIPASKECEVSV